jgi:hypothetical protein
MEKPSPNQIPESEEPKPEQNYPPEHIASIIERSQLAPIAGSILAQESLEPGLIEASPEELKAELSHEVKEGPISEPINAVLKTPPPSAVNQPDNTTSQPPLDIPKIPQTEYKTPSDDSLKADDLKMLATSRSTSIYKQAIWGGLAAGAVLILAFIIVKALNS